MPGLSQHQRVEEGLSGSGQRAFRSLENEISLARKARDGRLHSVSRQWRLQEAAGFSAMHGLPQTRPAQWAVRQATDRCRVRLVSHRGWMETIKVHGEGPRFLCLSAGGWARQVAMRAVPHP